MGKCRISSTSTKSTNRANTGNASTIIDGTFKKIDFPAYRTAKAKVINLEPENYDTIYAVPCAGNRNWYEAGDHSALMYFYAVCQRLELTTHFYSDETSLYEQYEVGYVRFRGPDDVRNNLKKCNLYASEYAHPDIPLVHCFKLAKTFTKKEISAFLHQERKRRGENQLPLPTSNLDPKLHQTLANFSARIHNVCNTRLSDFQKMSTGVPIIKLTESLLFKYHYLTYLENNHEAVLATLHEMDKIAFNLIIKIQVLCESKVWNYGLAIRAIEPLLQIRAMLKADIAEVQKTHALNPKWGQL